MKILSYYSLIAVLCCICTTKRVKAETLPALPQERRYALAGSVIDAYSLQELSQAEIYIFHSDTLHRKAFSDTRGRFVISGLPIGSYDLSVRLEGYEVARRHQVLVQAGRQVMLNIVLYPAVANDETHSIRPEKPALPVIHYNEVAIRSHPGAFEDPSQMLPIYADASPGDALIRNELHLSGNGPGSQLWLLEGIEIPNPHHFPGRLLSGGVLPVISPYVMGPSSLYLSAFPAEYGNATGGIHRLQMRRGNNSCRQFTASTGFLGLAAGAEGPLKPGEAGSYLLHYRYSPVSFLNGIIASDIKSTQYQDFALNAYLPTKKSGSFSLFAIGGQSEQQAAEKAIILSDKTYTPYQLESGLAIAGLKHQIGVGRAAHINTILAYSLQKSQRRNEHWRVSFSSPDFIPVTAIYPEGYSVHTNAIRLKSSLKHQLNKHVEHKCGLQFSLPVTKWKEILGPSLETSIAEWQASSNFFQFQAYSSWQVFLNRQLSLNGGVHLHHYSINSNSSSLEPRVQLIWQPNNNQQLSTSFGAHSRIQPITAYFAPVGLMENNIQTPNTSLGFSKALHYDLSYYIQFQKSWSVQFRGYYQDLFNLPVSTQSTTSLVNYYGYELITEALKSIGTGVNKGLSLQVQKRLSNGRFAMLSAGLLDSKYTDGKGQEFSTRMNNGWNTSLLLGKEFNFKKSVLSISSRIALAGGRPYTAILEEKSSQANELIQDWAMPYGERASHFFRLDAQVNYTYYALNHTGVFKLGLQNLTNRKNEIELYFDLDTDMVEWRQAWGIIPVFSYTVFF